MCAQFIRSIFRNLKFKEMSAIVKPVQEFQTLKVTKTVNFHGVCGEFTMMSTHYLQIANISIFT